MNRINIKYKSLSYLKKEWRKELSIFKRQPLRLVFSLSVGIFIGFTPTIGFQTILCYLFSELFNLSFFATFIGSSIPTGIPWQIPFTYYLCYRVGVFLLKVDTKFSIYDFKNIKSFLYYSILTFGKPLVIGCFFCAFVAGILTFLISYILILKFKNEKTKNI